MKCFPIKKIKSKQILYTLCFFGFVMVEFFTKNPIGYGNVFGYFFERMNNYVPLTVNSGFQQLARETLGLIMAVLVLSHYSRQDFKRNTKYYAVWAGVWVISLGVLYLVGSRFFAWYADDVWSGGYLYAAAFDKVILVNDLIYILLLVLLWGVCLITVGLNVYRKKRLPAFDQKLFYIWIGLMLLMLFSGSYYIWPFAYLVMFGCFYLTEYTASEKEWLLQGALNGILLGFAVLQSYALIVFPYTKIYVRYQGFNANPNWSSLFYAITLAAVFIKIIYHQQKGKAFYKILPYWLLSGVVLVLEFLTIGKMGYITVVMECIFFLGFMLHYGFRKILKSIVLLCLCFVLMFPVTFAAVRYIPAYTPLSKGMQEYIKMDLPDTVDSEKYVTIEFLFENAVGRIVQFLTETFSFDQVQIEENISEGQVLQMERERTILNAESMSEDEKEIVPQKSILARMTEEVLAKAVLTVAAEDLQLNEVPAPTEEVLPPNKIPVLTMEEKLNGFLARTTIYKYYLERLELFGQPYEEQGFLLAPNSWIGHAHNIFLQFATDFGVVTLILWMVVLAKALYNCIKEFRKTREINAVASIFFITIPLIFGMFEYSWGNGALSITMMFLSGWFALRSGVNDRESARDNSIE